MLSQPNIVSPLVRPPHANSFAGGVQRSPMGPPMSVNVGGGLMPHPRPQYPQHSQHLSRGPPGPSIIPRGAHASLKAEQDLKVFFNFLFICYVILICSFGQSEMGGLTIFVFSLYPPLGKAAG